jgi:hypothetical protein
MTSHTKHYIDLSDIVALRLECKHCRGTISLPIHSEIRAQSLRACPNCNEHWASLHQGANMEIAITNLVDTLKDFELAFRKRSEFSQEGGFLLSVEINSEAFEQAEKR